MSGRPCYYKQQQHSKLLAQFVSLSLQHMHKTHTPLHYCHINNVVIHFVPSCQDTRWQLVNVLDPLCRPSHYSPYFVVHWI